MTTTKKQDALLKLRRQLDIAEGYKKDSPDWEGIDEVLKCLRAREKALSNQIQVEIFKAEAERMNNAGYSEKENPQEAGDAAVKSSGSVAAFVASVA